MNKRHYALLKQKKGDIKLVKNRENQSDAYDHITVAEQFALEGNEEMVKQLLTVDEDFLFSAARGYAMANNEDAINRLLTYAGVDKDDFRLPQITAFIAEGYALAGNHAKVSELIPRLKEDFIAQVACGYARACNFSALNALEEEGHIDYNHLVYAYAYCGHHNLVHTTIKSAQNASFTVNPEYIAAAYEKARDELRFNHYKEYITNPKPETSLADISKVSTNMPNAMYNSIKHDAKGFAMANRDDLVERFVSPGERPDDSEIKTYTAIAEGYAIAGEHSKVKSYCSKYPIYLILIAEAYAQSGHHKEAKAYFQASKSPSIDLLMDSYRRAKDSTGCRDCLDLMLDNYLKERTEKRDDNGKTKEYFHSSLFAFAQKSFTQKSAAVKALKDALEGKNVDLSAHLSTLRNGELGKTIRNFVKNGGANILLQTTGVNTVSDFVRTLENKNNENRAGMNA